ncbi:MAG: hypothetical protein NT145_08255 [Elusimicrobia bacterium]|nr:hypothetical protein [Elusimicrobiota bacterium]
MCRMFALVSKNFVSGDNFFRFRELAGKKTELMKKPMKMDGGLRDI